MSDISAHIEPDEMPVCPLCDNDLDGDGFEVGVFNAHGAYVLCHAVCVEDLEVTDA